MRVLWITDVFPHAGRPYKGAWMVDLLGALSRHAEVLVLTPRYRSLWTPRGSFLEWYRNQPPVAAFGPVRALYPAAPAAPWGFTMLLQTLSMAFALLPVARREHLRRPFDLVHGHFIIPGGVAAAWIAGRLSLPLVLTAHGSDVNVFSRISHLQSMARCAYRRAAQVTAVSRCLTNRLFELGVSQACHIPNGCFNVAHSSAKRVRGRILFVGQLWRWKGPEVLLRAFVRVRREIPGASLMFVGEGPEEGVLREEAARSCAGGVEFRGPLPRERVLELMESADLFCLPSLREGMPVTVLEALAAGTPVVGSDVGGMKEVIRHPDLGLLVPPGDEEALGRALMEALRRPWDRDLIRAEARRYSWDRIAERYLEVYREAIVSRRMRSRRSAITGAE